MSENVNERAHVSFLEKELDQLISRYKDDRERHKKTALRMKMSTAVLAATATVLLGWQNPASQEWFKNGALALNAVITMFAAYEVFKEPRKLWVRETEVFSKLKDIQRDLKYDLCRDPNLSDDKLSAYKQQIKEALEGSLDKWVKDKANT